MTDAEAKLRAALERATNKMDEASHRLQNLHMILARELDEAVTRCRAVLRDTE